MDPNRKLWNERQQALKQALAGASAQPAAHEQALALCLLQHAAVHAAAALYNDAAVVRADAVTANVVQAADGPPAWSFEDEVWQGLSGAAARWIPPGGEHSIAWMVWHITRIEDMTMNVLVAGREQVADLEVGAGQEVGADQEIGADQETGASQQTGVDQAGGAGVTWLERMGAPTRDTGNGMDEDEIANLSASLHLPALRAYRAAVGRRTREIIAQLTPAGLRRPVSRASLDSLLADGSLEPRAQGVMDYWGGLKVSGLLLMPATRHPFLHWNEALRVKKLALRAGL